MGGKKARERLELAEAIARRVWAEAGVENPTGGELAAGMLIILEGEDLDEVEEPEK